MPRVVPKPKAPRVGRPDGQFTQARRIDKLREVLEASPAGIALEDLAAMLHLTTRSVRRYLRELSRFTDIESIPTTPGGPHLWRIKLSERGRTVVIRRAQAYGLLAGRRLFEVLRGSALFDEVDVAMRLVAQVAARPGRTARKDLPHDQRLEERFVFTAEAHHAYATRGEDIDELFRSVSELRALSCIYRGERRVVHPYAMVMCNGAIHCIGKLVAKEAGRDAETHEVHVLSFDRMSELHTREDARFVLPKDFEVGPFLHGELGIVEPPPPGSGVSVLIEFEPRAGDELRGRRVHPTQKIAVAADGRVRVSLIAPNMASVKAWVLGFGASAHVIEPPELAAEVTAELRRALERYGPSVRSETG